MSIGGDLNNKYVGDYDGEMSDTWFKWFESVGEWMWVGPDYAK